MRRIVAVLSTAVFAAASCFGQNTGAIHATVKDADGAPAEGAIVIFRAVTRNGRGGFLADCISDQYGSCTSSELPFGTYDISSANPKNGYPDTTSVFYAGTGAPQNRVALSGKSPVKDVDLNMGKQAGFLNFKVADGASGKPLNATVELRWATNAKNAFACSCLKDGERRLLIPADVPITILVSHQGYEDWTYSLGRGEFRNAVLVHPGEELSLDVRMWPKH